MQNDVLFYEKQKFNQWWLWLILLGVNGLMWYAIIQQVVNNIPFGDKPTSDTGLFIIAGVTILFTIAFFNIRLETQIKKDGIYVRFFPLHFSYKRFDRNDIEKAFVRKYSPIGEYGGWGIRYGFTGSGKAYNISGNMGLQLQFNNGKKLLIGTKKPEEMTKTLEQINTVVHV